MVMVGVLEIFLAFIAFLLVGSFHSAASGLPKNWPLVGMLPDFVFQLHRIHDRITEVLGQSGCSFMFYGPWLSNIEILGTVDPANINYIMSSNFSNFPKGSEFLKIFDILGDGIFNSDAELWRNQRRLAQALINHRSFHHLLVNTSKNKVENGLIPVLEHVDKHGTVLDLQDSFERFTFDVTCILVTGYDPLCLSVDFPEVQFARALDDAEEAIFYRHIRPDLVWKFQRWMKIGQELKLMKARETLDHITEKYIARKREELCRKSVSTEEEGEGFDLLTSYMQQPETKINMGSNSSKDDKFLRDTIINLLLAGRDTTSAALTWFFWLISKNPAVESKIREELKATIPAKEAENWRLFSAGELKNLVYLHGALCQSLRLYPPVPFQHKAPLQDDVLPSGHRVHPKMKIVFSLYAMGRMPSIWGEDCLEFKPERWITKQGKIKHEPSYKFLAFNAGPRTCLGKEIAFTQMKGVAAAIIHNYNLQVVEGHPVSPGPSVILHMQHGLKVKIYKKWV